MPQQPQPYADRRVRTPDPSATATGIREMLRMVHNLTGSALKAIDEQDAALRAQADEIRMLKDANANLKKQQR